MSIKDVYPIWKWSMLSWVIVGLVPLALLVATIYSAADNDPEGAASMPAAGSSAARRAKKPATETRRTRSLGEVARFTVR